ncbi:MAG: HD domain-containing protein [Polyangiaceae bacterium]
MTDLDELRELLTHLDGVRQSPRWHPEGDALFHSLQAFDVARRMTRDPAFAVTALFHDVGKAVDGATHDEVGADLLEGLLSDRAVWLVSHHLDLLREPRRARRRLAREDLRDLELLRAIDLAARRPDVRVTPLEDALAWAVEHLER